MSHSSFLVALTIYVLPTFGVILGSCMFFAPVPALLSALRRGSLGDLNPLPWAFMLGNTLGWTTYSFLTKDFFVFIGNAPPFLLAIYMNMAVVQLQYLKETRARRQSPSNQSYSLLGIKNGDEFGQQNVDPSEPLTDDHIPLVTKSPRRTIGSQTLDDTQPCTNEEMNHGMEYPIVVPQIYPALFSLSSWMMFFAVVAFFPKPISHDQLVKAVGILANLNLLFFFGAPLSTIVTVLRERDSSSIHKPTTAMTVGNCFFWTVYGLAIGDVFIYTPNSIGCLLGVIQGLLSLCIRPQDEHEENGDLQISTAPLLGTDITRCNLS